jgi:hypothetical protein
LNPEATFGYVIDALNRFGLAYLQKRFELKAALNTPNPKTFYGGGETGYTDYPTLDLQTA